MVNMELLICFAALLGTTIGYDIASIVGGSNANPNQYPYQISMKGGGYNHFCGGSLVRNGDGKIVVVTAAHCLTGESPDSVQVVVGRHTIQSSEENQYEKTHAVKKIVLHPHYNSGTMENDIAIMYLTEDVVTSPGVQPIELSSGPSVTHFNKDCIITGWGALTEGGSSPDVLQHASVDFYPDVKCTKDYGSDYDKFTMICGGKKGGGVDACQGDSGGPFACREGDKLVLNGVTSWGIGCARPDKAGIYTDVYMMRGWLNARLGL